MRGCFFGGAIGDASARRSSFSRSTDIRRAHGKAGLRRYGEAFGRTGAITDDTQMNLFTADGILRAYVRAVNRGICHTPSVVDHAYARWLETQGGERSPRWGDVESDGWLISVPALHHRRAPGNTCLSALRDERKGTFRGAAQRQQGVRWSHADRPRRGGRAGLRRRLVRTRLRDRRLDPGHPSGYLAAGALAELLRLLIEGQTMDEAPDGVERRLTE